MAHALNPTDQLKDWYVKNTYRMPSRGFVNNDNFCNLHLTWGTTYHHRTLKGRIEKMRNSKLHPIREAVQKMHREMSGSIGLGISATAPRVAGGFTRTLDMAGGTVHEPFSHLLLAFGDPAVDRMIKIQRFYGKCRNWSHNSKRSNPPSRGRNDIEPVTAIELPILADPCRTFENMFRRSDESEACGRGADSKCKEEIDPRQAYLHYESIPELIMLYSNKSLPYKSKVRFRCTIPEEAIHFPEGMKPRPVEFVAGSFGVSTKSETHALHNYVTVTGGLLGRTQMDNSKAAVTYTFGPKHEERGWFTIDRLDCLILYRAKF